MPDLTTAGVNNVHLPRRAARTTRPTAELEGFPPHRGVVVLGSDAQQQLHAIAVESYHFLYPLVTMEATRRQLTNAEAGHLPGRAPTNQFGHVRAFPSADMRVVVRPNFDTLYSPAFLDLTEGPVVVSIPDTDGRYYLLPILDMWTDVFASPGWRTSGTGAQAYAITPPGWEGTLPDGVGRIDATTDVVWVIGRTQTNGPADYAAVNAIQDGITATPLAAWGRPYTPPPFTPDTSVDNAIEPLGWVESLTGDAFFTLAAELLARFPAHVTDWGVLERAKRIGLVAGSPFVFADLDAGTQAAVQAAPKAAVAAMHAAFPLMAAVKNGWAMNTQSMGVYGNEYLKRAIVTQVGLGANQPQDAIYPVLLADADGQPVNGDHDYVLRFEADELPPVDGFWSLTMYDQAGFQVANELDRFALGDRDPLVYGADGSLELYVQRTSPGTERQANWLPSASGPLGLTLRLYAPHANVLDGHWAPPAVRRVDRQG
jgi:hypothetical protein